MNSNSKVVYPIDRSAGTPPPPPPRVPRAYGARGGGGSPVPLCLGEGGGGPLHDSLGRHPRAPSSVAILGLRWVCLLFSLLHKEVGTLYADQL